MIDRRLLSITLTIGLSSFPLVSSSCGGDDGGGANTDTEGADGTADGTADGDPGDSGSGDDGDTSGGGTTSSGGDGGTAGTTGAGTGSTAGTYGDSGGTGGGVECGNKELQCTNGLDDDGDGFFDLDDPECTGPCDDDEGSYGTGLPGDNVDCKQDCFFDGNSGQGEKCEWDLRCDPSNPGANIGCEYRPGNQCNKYDDPAPPECLEACVPLVPNGCDCYGCCRVETPSGPVDIFLNSGPDCSLSMLDKCLPCTLQIDDCGNPCEPQKCELCFGEDELPPGCTDPGCEMGTPTCNTQADCPDGSYCVTGCCIEVDPEG